MTWKQWIVSGMLAVLLGLSLTGCWDDETVTQRATAFVLSIMPASDHEFRFTFYFPNPAQSISTNVNLPSSEPFAKTPVIAHSISQAIREAQRDLARDLFLGQLQDIIVSRDIPAQNIDRLVQEYNRDAYSSNTVFVVAEPTGPDPLPVTTQEPVPSVYYTQYFNCSTCQPAYLSRPVWKVWDAFVTPGVSPIIPYASPPTRIVRMLVYPVKGRPVLMTRDESRGWALMMNHVHKESYWFRKDGGATVIKRLRARAHVQLTYRAGHLIANVRIDAHGSLIEWPPDFLVTPQNVGLAQAITSKEIITECLKAVDFANRTRTDPFGWGRNYLFAHPDQGLQFASQRGMVWPITAHVTVITHLSTSGVSD